MENAEEEPSVEIQFPLEFVLEGVPLSMQASAASQEKWKERLREGVRPLLPQGHFVSEYPIKVAIYVFSDARMAGDLDNIIKPILDSLSKLVYMDDIQVEPLAARKFEPGRLFTFNSPSPTLSAAIEAQGPRVYLQIDVSTTGEVT
jgi:crossover junction endodeoxyribonuclease RusA